MKTFVCPVEPVAARRLLICFVLVHVLLLMTPIECLPLFDTSAVIPSASSSSSPLVEDLLRLYNVSNEDVEAFRQKQIAIRHSGAGVHHQHNFPANSQHHHHQPHSSPHAHSEASAAVSASAHDAQLSIINQRNRSALQRKQEVFRNVLGFVNLNGRPQLPSITPGGTSPSAPPIPPFFPPFQRPEATVDLYERTRYLQPSCDGPKHADEDIWSSGSTPLSLHLFFNLSGIQSQTRAGFQLYVTGAKLRLLKFAEGEAFPAANFGLENADASSGSVDGLEQPLQTLKAVPFFDPPLQRSDEEKIRVSVHNYTRALKRNRAQKKKLLDSQMALAKEENYMKLDIKLAARWWLAPGGRNFGLAIEVEDTDGQRKPVTRFFRPRNCSSENEGFIRTDEILDPSIVASPVLELTVIEMPEGRNVFEVPSGVVKGRFDEIESVGSDDLDALSEILEEPTSRKHRHQHSSRTIPISQEEQADEAVLRINNRTLKSDVLAPSAASTAKHRASHRAGGHQQTFNHRPTSSPVPTLATLEDHDLFRDTEEDEMTRPEADESRNLLRSTSIFMQRMMQQQQHNSKMAHYPRPKDNRKQ